MLLGPILDIILSFIMLVFLGMLFLDIAPYLRRQRPEDYKENYCPKALVIIPCKGTDLTLKQNLKSISDQSYKNYRTVGVIDTKDDPAANYIRSAGITLLVSGYKAGRASGKVQAILCAMKNFPDFDVYVIADSDILAGKYWLKNLILPLSDDKIGISTTFPKFIPVGGFWSKVKFVWGFVGEGLMESSLTRFGWGGSLAFRSTMIDYKAIQLLKNSKYSVSDDICLTKIAKSKSLRIAYVKKSQPVVNSNDSFIKFIEWSNRQTALTLFGYKRTLYYGLAFYTAEILLMLSGILLSYYISIIFVVLFLHLIKSEVKTYLRAGVMDPTFSIITLFSPFLYLANLIVANSTDHITWRGRKYAIG